MKKVISLALSVFILCCAGAMAQSPKPAPIQIFDISELTKADSGKKWDGGGLISLSFSQVGFSNWSAGGENAIGLSSLASLHARYHCGKFIWLNDAQLGYGFQRLGASVLQKTTDQIELTTNAGFKVHKHLLVSFLANLQTQFQPGYLLPNDSILISNFFAPAYLVLALGVTYHPAKYFTAFISPATTRLIFVENQQLADQGADGVTPAVYDSLGNKIKNGARERTEIGAYIKANFSKEIISNFSVTSSLELFSNYLKNPQNIVVNWVVFLQLKVNKFISATVNTQLIYDDNVETPLYKDINGVNTIIGKGPRVQFKDVVGVGLAYNL